MSEFKRENNSKIEPRKALAPCPKCRSWNTYVIKDIFYCDDCGYVEGD